MRKNTFISGIKEPSSVLRRDKGTGFKKVVQFS